MMKFKVPKFLERETRILGIFTFRQLAFLGLLGVILLILYYTVPRALFFLLAIGIGGGGFMIIFVHIEGMPLGQYILNSIIFMFSSKKYFWAKSSSSPIALKIKKQPSLQEKEETEPIKIAPDSYLERLSSKIDLGNPRS